MSISAPRYAAAPVPLQGREGRVLALFTREVVARFGWGTGLVVGLSYASVVLIIVVSAEFSSIVGGPTVGSFYFPYASPIWPFLVLIGATAVGAGCISEDLGSRSITLFLSRPIHLTDYLGAKASAVAFWIGLMSIGPGLLGVALVGALGLAPLSVTLPAAAAYLASGLLTTLFFTALAVLLSSVTTRALYAGVGMFGITLSAEIAGSAVSGATGNSAVGYVSPIVDLQSSASAIFQTGATTLTVPAASAALLIGASVLFFLVAWLRLSRVEVVGE